MKNKKQKAYFYGLYAEWLASIVLFFKGYRILKRRYRCKVGEIDLIARKKQILVFVEVKGRSSLEKGLNSISYQNRRRIEKASQHFFLSHSSYNNLDIRFDAFVIVGFLKGKHIQSAWQLGE